MNSVLKSIFIFLLRFSGAHSGVVVVGNGDDNPTGKNCSIPILCNLRLAVEMCVEFYPSNCEIKLDTDTPEIAVLTPIVISGIDLKLSIEPLYPESTVIISPSETSRRASQFLKVTGVGQYISA
jgi:hypothetical protein